ncbi:MAG: hypothetical protein HYU80_00630 [Candidatus Blackburnbacteria bacterium]|nr:hypothetical protein [Candidatus Blackburnbacteria bacterium]
MFLTTAKILGLPTRRSWAQVYSFTPDEELLSSCGSLVTIAALTTTLEPDPTQPIENEVVIKVGKDVLTGFQEEYFKGQGTPFKKLNDATQKVVSLVTQDIDRLELLNCVLWKQYVYFCVVGGGEVWVSKDGRLSNLLKLQPVDGGVVCISGKLTGNEVFLFGTSHFFASVDGFSLEEIFAKTQIPDQIADNLNPLVHRKNNPLAAAAVFQARPSFSQSGVEKVKGFSTNFFKRKLVEFAQKLPESSVYIKKEERPRRTALSIGAVLLVILSVSIFFGLRQKDVNERKLLYENRLTEARTLYSDALETFGVDRDQARSKFSAARGIVGTLLAEGVKDIELDRLDSQMKQEEGAILGRVEVVPSLFTDLSIFRSGITALEIVLHKDKIAVFDTTGERFFLVSLATKETLALGGSGKTASPQGVAIYDGRVFTLTEKGIVEIDKQGTVETVVELDSEWGGISKIGVFGGNVYLLSKDGAIWRYPRVEAGFAAKQAWLSEDMVVDFSGVQDWTIDGSIWLLSSNGEISKFTRRARDSFRPSGVEGGLSNSTAIYTNEDLGSIFVLDKAQGRIVEVEKNGKRKLEYRSEELKTAYDLVVSKELGKIFVLQESRILEIPLR